MWDWEGWAEPGLLKWSLLLFSLSNDLLSQKAVWIWQGLFNLIPLDMKIERARYDLSFWKQAWFEYVTHFDFCGRLASSTFCSRFCAIVVLMVCSYPRIRRCHHWTISTLGWVEEKCAQGLLSWSWQHLTPSLSCSGLTSLLKPGRGPELRTIAEREDDQR